LRTPRQLTGDCVGTLTVVRYDNEIALVTANYVLRQHGNSILSAPVGTGRSCEQLGQFRWRPVDDGVSPCGSDGTYDLIFAPLSRKQRTIVDSTIVYPLAAAALQLPNPFDAVVHGFLAKDNLAIDIERRGWALPSYFEVTSEGIRPQLIAPYSHARYSGTADFLFDRRQGIQWESLGLSDGRWSEQATAPIPRGVSGGPVLFDRTRDDSHTVIHRDSVIGFLIEQYDGSHDRQMGLPSDVLRMTTSDILIQAWGRFWI